VSEAVREAHTRDMNLGEAELSKRARVHRVDLYQMVDSDRATFCPRILSRALNLGGSHVCTDSPCLLSVKKKGG
jgi:hypothetical protein